MLDLLCLISDGPCKNGPEVTERYYRLLKSIIGKELPGKRFELMFVVDEHMDVIKKTDIDKNLQRIRGKIEEEKPKVVYAFGDKAFIALGLDNTKVTKIANIPQKYLDTNIIVYPTYKYVSLLSYGSGYRGQYLVERQLARIKELIEEGYKPYDMGYYSKFITLYYKKEQIEDAKQALLYWKAQKKYCFDIETAGYDVPKDAQLNFRHKQAKITVIAFGNKERVDVFNTFYLPELVSNIKETLENEGWHITWNGKFDIEFCKYLWDVNFGNHTHIDGRACLYLIDINLSHLGKGTTTLKSTASTFLKYGASIAGYNKNLGVEKAIEEGDGNFLAMFEQEFMTYCGVDVFANYSVVSLLWGMLNAKQRSLVVEYYPDLDETLNSIHKRGITVDMPKLYTYMAELSIFLKKVEECILREVDTIGGFSDTFNPKSNQDLCKVLYGIVGIPPFYTEKGTQSVTTEILEKYTHIPLCKLMLDYRAFLKQHEIFTAVLENTKGDKCYPLYNQYKTASGRLASYKPPIQIIPKNKLIDTKYEIEAPPEIIMPYRPIWHNHTVKRGEDNKWHLLERSPNFKDIFIPDPGCYMLYGDYSQLEIVILANYIERCSPDKTLQKAILEKRDVHSYTASLVYSVIMQKEYTEEFITKNKAIDPYKEWRQDSKSVIFKLIYGGTYKSMAMEKSIPEESAKLIFDTFETVIPGIKDYMRCQAAFIKSNHSVVSYAGHTRNLGICKYDRNNNKAKNIGLNHPIQSQACFIVNKAMVKYHQELTKLHPKARILLTVHDSIASQVPNDPYFIEEGIRIKKYCMLDYVHEVCGDFLKIPVRVDFERGTSWHNLEKIK